MSARRTMRVLCNLLGRGRLAIIGSHSYLIVFICLVLMMSEVLRRAPGLMRAIGADRTPGKLECEHQQQAGEKSAGHGWQYSIAHY